MDNINDKIQLFEDKKIRTAWDEENEEWYFSIIDVISVLTEQADYQGARNYWKVLKKRLKDEGNETVTNCNRLLPMVKKGLLMLRLPSSFCGLFSPFRHQRQSRLRCGLPKSGRNALKKQ